MSTVKRLYEVEPPFQAAEVDPSAARHAVVIGPFRFADCVGGAPSQAELEAHLWIDAAGLAKEARRALDKTEAAAHKLDANVQTFLNFDATQMAQWITTNVSGAGLTLAQVKSGLDTALNVLGKLAQDGARGQNLRNGG